MSDKASGTFRAFSNRNYRIWQAGAAVSNIGTWMQRTAQDWIVLTELSHHNATAVGIVMGLQFGPQLVLLPFTGFAADRCNRRTLLFVTQSVMGLLALGLSVLTLTGLVQLWHVYVFALLLGCAAAFDAPVRQTFVGDLVEKADLANAVALNSTSFNAARMIGPAIAGALIAAVGSGWVFLINAASYVAVLTSIAALRIDRPAAVGAKRERVRLADGFRYIRQRPDLMHVLLMMFLIGTFGINFPIFISTMAVGVFHVGAGQFGALTSMMAAGSVTGALLAARRERPRIRLLFVAVAIFGATCALAALMPDYWLFAASLVPIGIAAQTFTTSTNGWIQLTTEASMRGRVMAIFLALALGGTPIGAPIVGWVADTFGPRWGLGVGAASGFAAVLVAAHYLMRHRRLHMSFDRWRPRFTFDAAVAASDASVPAPHAVE
ncbi:MFS transporter [Methylovirgula sp. 4M-Z18]|uniref:MFS transporter n=1 Tax=Methylovirgula sp. 4M-Z18 TaxID=2293567 RepID=UPI000E2F651C|nr:MFS transporter [Methylovirgula sp. 4M-Z18]RFB78209.1 MFS transporter [Methylovirgula sp. 4M-Z18]